MTLRTFTTTAPAYFGNDRVIGGLCRVAAEIDADGRIRQLADSRSLAYGELDAPRTPRFSQADAALHNAGFAASISDHIVQDTWDKWVQLAALGAIDCLFRGSIGQIVAVPGGVAVYTLASELLGKGGTFEEVAGILAEGNATISRHYAKWTKEHQARQDRVIELIHGTNLTQAEEGVSKC